MSDPRPPHPTPGPLPPEQPSATASSARAEGPAGGRRRARSPIIAPGLVPAAATTALAALLAGTAYLPLPVFACAVAVLQAVTAAGWFRLNGMWPARQGIALAFLAGVTADVTVLAVDHDRVPVALVGTFGLWFLLTLVLHLRNRSAPDERLYALTAALTSTALTVMAGGLLATLAGLADPVEAGTADLVTVGAAAVVAATLFRTLPLPPFASPTVAALAAVGAGTLAARLTGHTVGAAEAALLGAAAGLCALTGLRTASYDFPSRFVHMTAGVALPLTFAAPAVYALARLLT